MNIEQLHRYLGELMHAGVDPKMPVILPGLNSEDQPQELTDAMMMYGPYCGDPHPKMSAFRQCQGICLLLGGILFDMDTLTASHTSTWPPIEIPNNEDN